ncbi:MAG: heavy metal translocating P-type ATPase, partial [Clostridia bacterium]|nr:heavy metal translocating P-type ATPase [Clostridia bacterium]
IKKDDLVVFRDGCMIAVDGMVTDGIATVNEASMTGEPLAAEKKEGAMVYAGTVIEEGSITVRVVNTTKDTRISHIIEMIENGENLKASVQSRAEKMADKMVPYSLGLAALVYILTRNVTKAMSVLMVDYSCAIKLATPISVISSMREASTRSFVIKGGKHLESFAHADTILFDKTGTLTNACPVVEKVIPFGGYDADAVLRTAACLEEHFPHSVAKAVVKAALDKGLHHEEEHAEVEYVVAHGIVTTLHGKRAIIGSEHFVIEDEGVTLTVEEKSIIEKESEGYTAIYLAYAGKIAGVICISDPPRDEAKEAVELLKASGIENVIMLTGDHESAAKRIADMTGITEFNAQVLPEDKARVVSELKEKGHTVIMVGDGINDSPALALADVSVAMKDSSDLAREVADITLLSGDLRDLAILRTLSEKLFARIKGNYRFIAGFNSALILSGLMGFITPSLSSLMHNASTMLISAHSMTPLLKEKN